MEKYIVHILSNSDFSFMEIVIMMNKHPMMHIQDKTTMDIFHTRTIIIIDKSLGTVGRLLPQGHSHRPK